MENLKVQLEIIELGKTIVEELNLDPGVDTLSKWMAHYLAELIINIENCESDEEKNNLRKECCDIILKIWKHKEFFPQSVRPLTNLKPVIQVLEALEKNNPKYPLLEYYRNIPSGNPLAKFSNTVKANSEQLFRLSVYTVLHKELLEKDKKWIENYKNALNKEERKLIEYLDALLLRCDSIMNTKNGETKLEKMTLNERYNKIFEMMEGLIQEELDSLEVVKRKVLESLK